MVILVIVVCQSGVWQSKLWLWRATGFSNILPQSDFDHFGQQLGGESSSWFPPVSLTPGEVLFKRAKNPQPSLEALPKTHQKDFMLCWNVDFPNPIVLCLSVLFFIHHLITNVVIQVSESQHTMERAKTGRYLGDNYRKLCAPSLFVQRYVSYHTSPFPPRWWTWLVELLTKTQMEDFR